MKAPHRHHRGQQRIRFANDRKVIELIRQHQALSKVEIAARTGLSAQAAAQVIARLESQQLVRKGANRSMLSGRSKGQPRVPYMLNPDGAYSLGLKIGRQQIDLTLVNLCGDVIGFDSHTAIAPDAHQLTQFLNRAVPDVCKPLTNPQQQRVCGVGVGVPYFVGQWSSAGSQAALFEDVDKLYSWLQDYFTWPVCISNDDNAACLAQLFCTSTSAQHHFAYVFLGTFIGGALVVDGDLHPGQRGNAGAIASLPVMDSHGKRVQLHELASVYGLKQRLSRAQWQQLQYSQRPEEPWQTQVQAWMAQASAALAQAAVALQAVLDTDTMIIDGILPNWLLQRLVVATNQQLGQQDWRGIQPLKARQGEVGAQAQALGCAHLPLLKHYYLH